MQLLEISAFPGVVFFGEHDYLIAEVIHNTALDEVVGDVIYRIYKYFLNKFAKNIAQDDRRSLPLSSWPR